MAGAVDLSVLLSGLMAAAWFFAEDAEKEYGGATPAILQNPVLRFANLAKDWRQVLPTLFLLAAASSFLSPLGTLCSLSQFDYSEAPEDGGWLGIQELSAMRRSALLVSLALWRADKLEDLGRRMQRSVRVIQSDGFATALQQSISDPYGYLWPALWGSGRRVALVAIASFGCVPFIRTAFPAVVLDEFLNFAVAKVQRLIDQKVVSLPAAVDLVMVPLADLVHFIPVIVHISLLGICEYPSYERGGLLAFCAFAWTMHNCHLVYSTLSEVPVNLQIIWAGQGGQA
jgi:hypothetical protein